MEIIPIDNKVAIKRQINIDNGPKTNDVTFAKKKKLVNLNRFDEKRITDFSLK